MINVLVDPIQWSRSGQIRNLFGLKDPDPPGF